MVKGMRRQASGFTVLEVTVAIGILTLGVLGVIASIATTKTFSGASVDNRIAVQAIRDKIEELERQVMSITDTSVVDFVNQTATATPVPDLLAQSTGAPAQLTFTFLTEAEANAYWNPRGGVTCDFDFDKGTPGNRAVGPTTSGKVWKAYPVRIRVAFGDRTGRDPQTGNVHDRALEITTIVWDRNG
jgi:type II secretory pathway pseudopilin PulG